MEYVFSLSGSNTEPCIREFDINTNTNIKAGYTVSLGDNNKVTADTYNCVGVAAENHPGVADDKNPRANGNKIKVICSPDAVYRLYGIDLKFIPESSTATKMTTVNSSIVKAESIYGKYVLVMVSKDPASENTDTVGTVRYITDNTYNSSTGAVSMTVNSGGIPHANDVYCLVPGTGVDNISTADYKSVYISTSSSTFRSVGYDANLDNVKKRPSCYVRFRNLLV